jgi:hypothetical protein
MIAFPFFFLFGRQSRIEHAAKGGKESNRLTPVDDRRLLFFFPPRAAIPRAV